MRSVVHEFNKIAAKEYRNMGFTYIGHVYARQYNDVLQIFSCAQNYASSTCSIYFDIIPLSMGFSEVGTGSYHLNVLDMGYLECGYGWKYNRLSLSSINRCVESMINSINNYLIPLFQRCNSCKSTLHELLALDELLDSRRIELLALRGESDCAAPWQERSLFDVKKYYMALKANDREYALTFLKTHIDFYDSKLKAIASSKNTSRPPIVQERYRIKREQYVEHINRLSSNDNEYFDAFLAKNEAYSLMAIEKLFVRNQGKP